MPTICHFEIPADNVDRAKKFYSELFDWKIEQYPEMEYWLISTKDKKGKKGLGGGLMKRVKAQQQITVHIDVPSIDKYAKKVEENGGKILMPKTSVPTIGWFAVCLDTENNVFELWEDDKKAK